MRRAKPSSAFTLVEVLIVVVIMAVLAATIIPTFQDASADAKISSAKTNIGTLRSMLALYKSQHGSYPPNTTAVPLENSFIKKTKRDHSIDAAGEYGPYLQDLPPEPFTGSDTVTTTTTDPISVAAGTTTGGYLYNVTTGEIRINYNTTTVPASSY